jgi:hypothetical protein
VIAAFLAWQVSGVPRTTVTYRKVPPAVLSARVLAWHDGRQPVELRSTDVVIESGTARVACVPGTVVIVSFARADGAYLLDGPFDCPAVPVERREDPGWRRTVRVRSPPDSLARGDVSWLPAGGDPPGSWPRCVWTGSTAECWGSGIDARGALLFTDGDRVWWTIVAAGAPGADFQQSAWGRLIEVSDAVEYGTLTATIAHPVTSAARQASLRLETALVTGANAVPVAGAVVWVHGDRIPASAWIELRAPGAAPVYLPLDEVAHAPPSLPLWVTLGPARMLDGVARGAQGGGSGAAVTLFRLIDPQPARAEPRQQARRVFAAEQIADAAGGFRFDAVGDADYEVVAWHPQLGRGIAPVGRSDTSVTVRLESAGQVRGRVIAGGKPLAGVDVISLPDPQAYAQAADLTDVKGGDGRTGADGRFVVSLAPGGGGGEVRVGGGSYPIRRFPLPRAPVPIVDLGDIDLGAPIEVTVVLDRDPGCDVRATGPVGRSGLQVIGGTRAGPGLFRIVFPEEGMWEVHLLCGRDEHALDPTLVFITQAKSGKELRMMLR